MNSSQDMDIENQGETPKCGELVVQGDRVSYRDAYKLNGFTFVETPILIEIISLILEAILKETDQIGETFLSGFTGKSVPGISVRDYLIRISTRSHCSDECLVLALIYIDRITEKIRKFMINSLNIHRYEAIWLFLYMIFLFS